MTEIRSTVLPYHRPWIGEEEIAEVVDTLKSGWLTMGPKTIRFEEAFASFIGAKHAVAVSSCTAALSLALDVLGIGAGDEVITSTMTFTATAAVVIHAGAKPILVDCEPETLNMSVEQAVAAVTPATRAVIPVHMAGHPCDMDGIAALARRHRLAVIEDGAHALPASYKGRRVGTISDLTAFSFYAGKNMTTGEGGMITTQRDEWADLLRTRRLHGLSRDAWARHDPRGSWRYDVTYPGFKYNMTDINAAIGLQQLVRLPKMHEHRTQLVARYLEQLHELSEVHLPAQQPEVDSAWHLFIIRLALDQLSVSRDEIIGLLREQNICTSVTFIPLHLHSYSRNNLNLRPEDFPNATALAESIIALPLYPRMSTSDVDEVCRALRQIIKHHRR